MTQTPGYAKSWLEVCEVKTGIDAKAGIEKYLKMKVTIEGAIYTAMNDSDIYKYSQTINAMQTRVEKAIYDSQMECHLSYLAFSFDENGLPIDNLDDMPIGGNVCFCQECSNGTVQNYSSKVMQNPTWLEIAVLANQMIKATDGQRKYLKGVEIVPETDDIIKAQFIIE